MPRILNDIICLPLKADFICGLDNSDSNDEKPNVCDPSDVIDSKFGLKYAELKEITKKFTGDASLNYTVSMPQNAVASMKCFSFNEKVDTKLAFMKTFVNFTCSVLVFIYFKIVYGR